MDDRGSRMIICLKLPLNVRNHVIASDSFTAGQFGAKGGRLFEFSELAASFVQAAKMTRGLL